MGVAEPGTAAEVRSALAAAGLPTKVPAGMSSDRIVGATHGDKKARGGSAEYALPRRSGRWLARTGAGRSASPTTRCAGCSVERTAGAGADPTGVTAAVWATAALVVIARPLAPRRRRDRARAGGGRRGDAGRRAGARAGAAVAAPGPRPRRPRGRAPAPLRPSGSTAGALPRHELTSPRAVRAQAPGDPGMLARAKPGEPVTVTLTAYCLKGTTRRGPPGARGDRRRRPAALPARAPRRDLQRRRVLGRYLVTDTGGVIKGPILDIWTPSCDVARRFGRRRGYRVGWRRSGRTEHPRRASRAPRARAAPSVPSFAGHTCLATVISTTRGAMSTFGTYLMRFVILIIGLGAAPTC
jgi:3D (Asp-Asp-Asp) domain-containing protein